MSSQPISSMLLIIGIYIVFASLSLANQEGQSPAVDGCQKPVPNVKDECQYKCLTLKYLPVLVPPKNAKLSKRFQISHDDDAGIGEDGNRKIKVPKRHRKNPDGGFQKEMEQGAMLADYLGVWMLGIDLKYVPNCPNIVTSGNCKLETNPLVAYPPHTYVLANELKGGEQISISGLIGSQFKESNWAAKIVFLYNAKNDETRNVLLLPDKQQNEEKNLMSTTNLILGEWLFGLHFVAEDNGNGTLPMMKTQEMKLDSGVFTTEWVHGTKTTRIGDFVVKPGVDFELRIDVPSVFKKEGEGDELVEMENYRAELKYDGAKQHDVLEFGLNRNEINRKFFPFWKIQAINFENVKLTGEPTVNCVKGPCKMSKSRETDYAISILHLTEVGKPKTGGVLKPGDRITINGNMPADGTEFSINFCYVQVNCIFSDSTVTEAHPINENAKSGDNILQIRSYGNKLAIRYWTRGVGDWTDYMDEKTTDIVKGAPFRIDIDILLAGYTIGIGGKQITQIDTNKATTMLPPWSAEHIFIYGDVKVASGGIIRTYQLQGLEMPHVVRLERELVPNCVIKIHGKPSAPAEWNLKDDGKEQSIFSIGLYHNGLMHYTTHNTQLGDTVMEIDFRASKVGDAAEHLFEGIAVFAYYPQPEDGYKVIMNAEVEMLGEVAIAKSDHRDWSKLTFVEIHMFEDRFDIITDVPEWKMMSMTNHLPLWASQYLTVKGMFTLEKEIEFSGCA